jgi:hypothetical protein
MRKLLTEGTDVTGDETMVDPLETDMGGDGGLSNDSEQQQD